jgi:hypothetical protein
MLSTNAEFVEDLVRTVPQLAQSFEEHLASNRALLPHVFMAEIARFTIAEVSTVPKVEELEKLLIKLDQGLEDGSEEIKELIVVSFIENLIGESDAIARLTPYLRPTLKAQVQAVCGVLPAE